MSKHTSINENLDVWTADSDGRIPITVSAVGDGGMERITTSLTPVECDTAIAAINAALGRPVTPLEARLLDAIAEADEEADAYALKNAETECPADGRGEGLRMALRMLREAGPTVPRAAVAAVVPLLAGVSTMLADSDDAEAKREAVRRLDRIIVALGRMVTDGPTPTEDR